MALGGRINAPSTVAADAVTGAKIADDAVDSEHYTDGSIDTAHIADNQVTVAKLEDIARGSIIVGNASAASAELTKGSANTLLGSDGTDVAYVNVTSAMITDGTIATADIADNNVTLAKIADIARGSIIIGNASAATAELTKGGANEVLTSDGTDIAWAAAGGISTTLADGNILVGNGSNVATSVNPSGDVDIATDGTFSIASGVVVDADVNASAAIAVSKTALTAGTNISLSTNTLNVDDAFLVNDGNDTTTGIITAGGLTLSEAASVSIGTPLLASTDHTYSGMSAEMLAGGAIGAQDLVCIHTTTSEVVVADASAVGTARAIGIAPAAISDTATGTVLLQGFIRDDSWNWTTGGVLYTSETAGDLTQTAPTTDGAFVQVVGIALSPDVAYINPSLDIIEHA